MTVLARLSIRWRITLGSLIIAALFFGLAVAAFRSQVQSILESTNETLLEHDAAPITARISEGAATIDEPGHGQLVAVVDPAGMVRQSTLPRSLADRLDELLRRSGEPRDFATRDADYLVLTQTVRVTDGAWHVVTARNKEASVLLLDRLTIALLVGALALVAGFGVASWLLTGAALRPVSRMRRQAEALSAPERGIRAPERPLAVGPARDEISALATTLNDFIAQLHLAAARERQMVSDASHELRSPIAVLKTQLELAHLSSGDADALEREISSAERSLERLSALATRLLELSELESAPSDTSSSWFDLATELAAAADRARLVAAGAPITIDFQTVEGAPATDTHPDDGSDGPRYPIATSRFGRLIDNLTSNAVNAMPLGGDIQLRLEQGPAQLELSVVDSGPGLPEEFLPIAFHRFTRPDRARSAATGGSGLGLAIARAIVVSARGEILLLNRAEGGLAVTVTLPRTSQF